MLRAGSNTKCVADRASRITRDTGPSAALSGIAAHAYAATPPTPFVRASLTRSLEADRSVPRFASSRVRDGIGMRCGRLALLGAERMQRCRQWDVGREQNAEEMKRGRVVRDEEENVGETQKGGGTNDE